MATVVPKGTTDYAEIQKNEVEVLQSIYMEDFEEVKTRPAAWSKSPDLAFRLVLRAYSNPEILISLLVHFPTTYPKTPPVLKLENNTSNNPSTLPKLQYLIETKPKELLGSEMIFEITSDLRDILETAAQTKAENEGLSSLEAERANRLSDSDQNAKDLQEAQRILDQADLTQKNKALAQQVSRENTRQEAREKAQDIAQPTRTESQSITDYIEPTSSMFPEITLPRPVRMADANGKEFTFSTVTVFRPKTQIASKRTANKTVSIAVVELEDDEESSIMLFRKKIVFREGSSTTDSLRGKLTQIEETLNELIQYRHDHVVDLLSFKIDKKDDPSSAVGSPSVWELSLFTEHTSIGSLSDTLIAAGSLEPRYVRSYTKQILDGLESFDQHGYVHPALHLSNVLLFPSRAGKPVVKISDGHGLGLKEIYEELGTKAKFTSAELPLWAAPELNDESPKRTNKTCIWELGRMVLEMIHGKGVVERYTSPQNYIKEDDRFLSDAFRNFLGDVFHYRPHRRSKAFELLTVGMLQETESKPFFQGAEQSGPLSTRRIVDETALEVAGSRFKNDFENDHNVLGRGAFGKVFKAKHRLDGRYYAVKEIRSDSAKELRAILREGLTLARLNHPHVVRYFSAWIEDKSAKEPHSPSTPRKSKFFRTRSGPSRSTTSSSEEEPLYSEKPDIMSNSGMDHIVFGFDSEGEGNEEGSVEEDEEDDTEGSVNDTPSQGDKQDESKGEDDEDDYDDEAEHEDPESSSEDDVDTPEIGKARTLSQSQTMDRKRHALYIQMEFCEKRTLRHIINEDGPRNIDQGWNLFRQILDGLAHIHKMGIIHRDLKPENIFMDKDNNPRIGDFGLATSGTFTAATGSNLNKPSPTHDSNTRDVGTPFYTAPELSSLSTVKKYNSKVDMYSLGVMFFEMCYPAVTGHERFIELTQIRSVDFELPDYFLDPEHLNQGDVIKLLLVHRPSERPSAVELFLSGKVPEPVEAEKLRQYIANLAEAGSPEYEKLVRSLFSQSTDRVKQHAWNRKAMNPTNPDQFLTSDLVRQKLTNVFERHGAVDVPRKMIFPRDSKYSNPASVLDQTGMPLQLAYDLTLPHVISLCNEQTPFERSFAFGKVYRAAQSGSKPREHGEIDFDIVSTTSADLALKEAEALKVLDEVIDEFPPLRALKLYIHLNHADLLDLVLDYCEINDAHKDAVKESLSRLSTENMSEEAIRTHLQTTTNASSAALSDVVKFNFRGELNHVRQRVESLLVHSELKDRLGPIFVRIEAVLAYARRFQVGTQILVHPLGSFDEKLFRGSILFHCIVEAKDKRKQTIAVGGRYDSLIAEYFLPASDDGEPADKPRAVGFHMPWDDLSRMMTPRTKGAGKKVRNDQVEASPGWRPHRCDVLVVSFDTSILRSTCLDVLQRLWSTGISAELSKDFGSLEELLIATKAEHYGWIVLVRHDMGAAGDRALKVRSLAKREDVEVNVADITSWLAAEIRERDLKESGPLLARLSRRRPSHGAPLYPATAADAQARDVHVLGVQHKGKKTNRQAIVDAACQKTQDLTDGSMSRAPVAAIETSDEILGRMRDTRLADAESWRALIQSAPPQERKYLGQVLDLLKRLADEGGSGKGKEGMGAFVFNFRTKACFFYDFGTGK